MATRDEILEALFAQLQSASFLALGPSGATTWVESSRRLKLFGDVSPDSQPAMFMTDHSEQYKQIGRGIPPKRVMMVTVFCYARCDGGLIGSTIINNILTAVEKAISPNDPTANIQNLGNRVYNCWIEGSVLKDPGDLDDQALLIVPITVTWP